MSVMTVGFDVPLARFTTLRLGGAARRFVEVHDEATLIAAVADADARGEPVFILGGGSNVVVADGGFPGLVVRIRLRGMTRGAPPRPLHGAPQAPRLTVAAGEPWDDFVAFTVREGLAGVECLSGIPGQVGATPIQNVGAYGQEVSRVIVEVRAYDREGREVVTLPASDCGFGYRASRFKATARFVVLAVTFALEGGGVREGSAPVAYPELARKLGVPVGGTAPLAAVREAVLSLRRSKGMVVDEADPDSVSAGSFFVNPVLDERAVVTLKARVRAAGIDDPLPLFPAENGGMKVSAAWLIERAGFVKGFGEGAVGISRKHSLALVHRVGVRGAAGMEGGSARALLALASSIAREVQRRFGVTLAREPVLIGDLGEAEASPALEGAPPDA